MSNENLFPLLPLRDVVVFPHMMVPLFVGREKSISALNEVMKTDKKFVLVTQKNSEVDDPEKNDVFVYGCKCTILQLLKLPDGTVKLLVEGIKRVKILDFNDSGEFITCKVSPCEDCLLHLYHLQFLQVLFELLLIARLNNILFVFSPFGF